MARKPSPSHRPAAKNWLSSWGASGSDLERPASSSEHLATGTDEPTTNKTGITSSAIHHCLPPSLNLHLLHQMLASGQKKNFLTLETLNESHISATTENMKFYSGR